MKSVVVALAFLCVCCGEPPAPRESPATWRPLGSWRGHGNQQLETFPITGGTIRLHWETSNATRGGEGRLKVHVLSGDSGRVIAEPIDVRGVGRDSVSLVIEHHRVYLTVESANVDWSIRAEEAALLR